nr:helix-turn-helix domain-containing protein [Caproicibacter fermentans]
MQTPYCSNLDKRKLCSFDLEVIEGPTKPLLHEASRFLLINKGKGKIRIQNTEYDLEPGSFVAILPWEISEVPEVSETLQYYILVYRFDMINEIIKSFYNSDNQPMDVIHMICENQVVHCDKEQMAEVQNIFSIIRNEVGVESTIEPIHPKALSNIYINNQLVNLIVLFIRIGEKDQLFSQREAQNLNIDRCGIFRYIYTHLNKKLNLKTLSKTFYLSESSISLYVKQVTGLSFSNLIDEMRVAKTINYLLYTDFTLEELAGILGYVDASHVSKVFAARIGMKANEYRKTYQKVSDICKVRESQKAYAIVAYIYRNSRDELTAKSVAKNFHISVIDLHQILMYEVEKNFEDFLNYIRVNQSCKLLLQSNKSIIDVAIEVGYNTEKTFTRNFLKFKMMTPGIFRNNVTYQQTGLSVDAEKILTERGRGQKPGLTIERG